jgi:hypothetical protein
VKKKEVVQMQANNELISLELFYSFAGGWRES